MNKKQPIRTKQYEEGLNYIDQVLPHLVDPKTDRLKRLPSNTELSTAMRQAGYRWTGYTYLYNP